MTHPKLTITCPATGPTINKVAIIKAIRSLTLLGLREAKDIADSGMPETLIVNLRGANDTHTIQLIEEQIKILRTNRVDVADPIFSILEDLRKLSISALAQGEDELANEILQLILAEKLRRNVLNR